MRRSLWVLAMLAGCNDHGAAASEPASTSAPRQLVGVYPENWRCDSIVTLEVLGQLLGATAKQLDSAMPVTHGLPAACSYEILMPDPEYWSFDVDCRDGMKHRADLMFAQGRALSEEAIERYAHQNAGTGKPNDAGVGARPEPAVDVAVGAKGLDYRGQGLVFIDDDAPCYVRVAGKDAARRLALARLIAKNLTLANAPMTPRALP